jgi:Ca2+-binding EF-hand superfamily protein
MRALDSNTNGVLEATEIASAPKSLATLDADSDGKLSATELMPLPPGMTSAQRPALPAGVKLPSSPVQKVLDANADGELDATEISNAATTLLKLDADSDGQLSQEEMRPSRPEGGRGPGGGKQSPPQ